MPINMMNRDHLANSEAYRTGYDNIKWGKDETTGSDELCECGRKCDGANCRRHAEVSVPR
jgi:hypothetical protein